MPFSRLLCFLPCLLGFSSLLAQPLYFPPPTSGSQWETVAPASLGWNEAEIDTLEQFLADNQTKAFLVLYRGRIVIEQYYDQFTQDSVWYWASAGKTLTAFLTGMAQQAGLLSIEDTSRTYLGAGWTGLSPAQEQAITIWHQLTMTSGLDDGVSDVHCTDPACLQYLAAPGTRWAYHNAPYTLLREVVENASGQNYNLFTNAQLKQRIGMDGFWLRQGYNNLFVSTPRSMARFGLLNLSGGIWDGDTLLRDTAYFRQMTTPSQSLNPAYGYLWWLNGQGSFRLPGLQFSFQGPLLPHAPADLYAAIGKNGQIINVVPSEDLVVVRMGNNPDNSLVSNTFNDALWQQLAEVMAGSPTALASPKPGLRLYPNPTAGKVTLDLPGGLPPRIVVLDGQGKRVGLAWKTAEIDLSGLPAGRYTIVVRQGNKRWVRTVKKR